MVAGVGTTCDYAFAPHVDIDTHIFPHVSKEKWFFFPLKWQPYLRLANSIRSPNTTPTPMTMERSTLRVLAATSTVANAAPVSARPLPSTVGATMATTTAPGR